MSQDTNDATSAATGGFPRLYDENEAAALLKIAPGTMAVWRHFKRGPKYVKVGARVRYTEEALLDFLASSE